ncbi:MAG: phosphoribosylanthranilate isomerase [Candidatus Marinimicrobia bacterium]|nr:phosphoribosylanthranilate isomerase [Candidatus Neomarinimicrobiota bacterium]
MKKTLIKVCCISTLTEAIIALEAGADLLGLVSEMPSGPGVISLENIAKITSALPPGTKTVLLTSRLTSQGIQDQHKLANTWGIQIVDALPIGELKTLRKALPKIRLFQVVHVHDKSSITEALGYEHFVDFILLDSGNPHAALKTLGGTGETHDWTYSREICLRSNLPVFLAGGLNPNNISEANNTVRPHGFDLCSGVRTGGYLDPEKLAKFMALVHVPTG